MRWTSLALVGLGLATASAQAPLSKASRQADAASADDDCPAENVSFELITGNPGLKRETSVRYFVTSVKRFLIDYKLLHVDVRVYKVHVT
jgi:hypothetical protein